MGPIALFDKSFLQSLSVDEAVWFDHFFVSNICPVFFVETLADLKKNLGPGRTAEQEVATIAAKTPQLSGSSNVFHLQLCLSELLGGQVEMSLRPIIAGGRLVRTPEKSAAVFEEAPEAKALSRWMDEQFREVERDFASEWRSSLGTEDTSTILEALDQVAISPTGVRSLDDARSVASALLREQPSRDRFELMMSLLGVTQEHVATIEHRWIEAGSPPISQHSPYAAFVLEVLLFYYLAAAKSLISAERATNKIDVSYLAYLPFCMIFVSSDKLHRRSAPLFLTARQDFVWGPDLKADLGQIDAHFDRLDEEQKEKGVFAIARKPPETEAAVVTGLWDKHCRADWRAESTPASDDSPPGAIAREIRNLTKSRPLEPAEIDFDPTDPDAMVVTRKVRQKRGKWWQIAKGLPEQQVEEQSARILDACVASDWQAEGDELATVLADFDAVHVDAQSVVGIAENTIKRIWSEAPEQFQARQITERLLLRLADRDDEQRIVRHLLERAEALLGLAVTRLESLRRTLQARLSER